MQCVELSVEAEYITAGLLVAPQLYTHTHTHMHVIRCSAACSIQRYVWEGPTLNMAIKAKSICCFDRI